MWSIRYIPLNFRLFHLAKNKKGREINGVVLLDKSSGISSNRALQQVKRLFFAKKAGHTGALDPLASGILPICLGQATKIAGFLLDDDKRYFARAQLGQTTDTGDSEGKILQTRAIAHLLETEIRAVVASFVGKIEQIPPMYSALKRDGQPLYKLARQGITVERKARQILIEKIAYLGYENGVLSLEISCSKGTYIRTLIEDIGNKLGCGAHVITLRRTGFAHLELTQTSKFSTLETLAGANYQQLDAKILPSEQLLPNLASAFLDSAQSGDIKFGRQITHPQTFSTKTVKLFDQNQQFLGIGVAHSNNIIAPKRLFVQANCD